MRRVAPWVFRGDITNQFGGDQISHQRINVYIGGDGDQAAALPGTNMNTATPWSRVVVIDGRFDLAGVYAPDGNKLTNGTIPQAREIVLTVPRSALGDVDPRTARYGTAMFGNAEGGEGIGNHDSDTRDPNAIDVIVGSGQTQAQVLDRQAGAPTRVPMLRFADTTAPTVAATLGAPASFGSFTPGVTRDYAAATALTVTSSAGNATLGVADLSNDRTGRLVNGSYSLEQPLQVRAATGTFAPVGGAANRLMLLGWNGPVTNDQRSIEFKQSIAGNEGLRQGNYGKTLTFTLSTTAP